MHLSWRPAETVENPMSPWIIVASNVEPIFHFKKWLNHVFGCWLVVMFVHHGTSLGPNEPVYFFGMILASLNWFMILILIYPG